MATVYELAKHASMRDWTLPGRNAVVKVIALDAATGKHPPDGVRGYITQARWLKGLNSDQIERDLGLPPQSLHYGAYVYWLHRLPKYDEVEFRYFASMPDGKVWTAEMHDELDHQRSLYTGMRGDFVRAYPPGADVPQWQLRKGVVIPFAARAYVGPTIAFEP